MAGKYKRQVGSRPYRNYSDATLFEAIDDIRRNKLSIRKASEKYGIHRNTLWLKLKGKHENTPGHPTVFTNDEEESFVAHCITMSDFGFPVTGFDLRCIAKSYLDRVGRTAPCFKNNFPGVDWQQSFLSRHQILTQRFAQNISLARAAVNEEVVNKFFDDLEVELAGIPGENIWNYDKTNLVDDPGSCKIITKRGTKYPEKIRNSTKACTSLMFCGNAVGQLAPLYVNYKSKHLWNTWTEGGPKGTRYNCTSSGWFDYNTFEDFFRHTMLPILKRQDGKKAFIGDKLSSHLNIEVIRQCEEHNIRFIALPPNATHLLQPIDVAFFRPLKRNWKKVLTEWKESAVGSRSITIPKQEFPGLLTKLMTRIEENEGMNMSSGFRKCGIYPLNREEVLNRLCNRVNDSRAELREIVGDSFIKHLTSRRTEVVEKKQRKKRRLNITPGKGISVSDLSVQCSSEEVPDPLPGSSSNSSKKQKTSSSNKTCTTDTSDESDEQGVTYAESDMSWHEESDTDSEDANVPELVPFSKEGKIIGHYVVVVFEGMHFPGIITKINKKGALVNAMEPMGKHWRWPSVKDEIWYGDKDIICKINHPKQRGKREIFDVPELAQILENW